MPKYRIETDQGNFEIDLDREATQSELQDIINQQTQTKKLPLGQAIQRGFTGLGDARTAADIIEERRVRASGQPLTKEDIRLMTELGLTIAGVTLAPQLTIPATAGRLGAFGVKALNLGLRAVGAGGGGATGSLVSEPFDPSGKPLERAVETGKTMATAEVVGAGIAAGTQKVLAPVAKKITARGREAFQVLRGKVTPAETTESFMLDIAQNISESSFTGGGRFQAFRIERDALIKELADEVSTVFGRSANAEAAGRAFFTRLESRKELWDAAVTRLYNRLDDMVGGVSIDLTAVKQFAAKELERLSLVPSRAGGGALVLLKQIGGKPDAGTFGQAQSLRSFLLKMGRNLTDPADRQARAIALQLAKRVDNAMERAAAGSGSPELMQAFRKANAIRRAGAERFENEFMQKLIETHPEKVVKSLMAPRNSTNVQTAFRAVGPKSQAANDLRSAFTREVILDATDKSTGEISGRKILTRLENLRNTTDAFLPGTLADQFRKFARALDTVQAKQGQGLGRIWIQLTQAGAVFGLATGKAPATSSAIIVGPAILSEIFTRPKLARWLIQGIQLRPGTKEAILVTNRLLFLMNKEGLLPDAEAPRSAMGVK